MLADKIKVEFTGKEYLDYIKYKDSKRNKFRSKKENHKFITELVSLFLFMAFMFYVFYRITYVPSTPSAFEFTWEGVGIFLTLCVGLGWVFHGVGFLLIRR